MTRSHGSFIWVLVILFAACSGDTDPDAGAGPDTGAAPRDAGIDSSRDEAGTDAGPGGVDSGGVDSGGVDSGDVDAGETSDAGFAPIPDPPYMLLSETGGYADLGASTLNPAALEFEPRHRLWTDGASKRRWIILPPGGVIDNSDPDHWVVPVGTRTFKEFSLPGGRLETRLIQRVADTGRDSDWWLGAFVWNAARTEATFVVDGASDVLGTNHDVPSQRDCLTCHGGEAGRGLGFSAVQLSGASPLSLTALAAMGRLSDAQAPTPVPGNAVESAALGYLHANCGHCHNDVGDCRRDTDMILRIEAGESVVTATRLYRSTVDVRLDEFRSRAYDFRIVSGDPDRSAIPYRMSVRDASRWGGGDQMPPLGTEIVHPEGLASVRTWISSL